MDAATTNETPEIKLHFLDYWRVIRLRRSLILMVFFLCLVTSTLLAIWLPKVYSSSVQIEVHKDDPEVAITDPHTSMFGSDPYFLTTQFKIIESYTILTNVITTLRLDEKLAQQNGSTRWTVDDTFDYLASRISVDQKNRMTTLVEITVKNSGPDLAAKIANAISDSYKEFRLTQWKATKSRGIDAMEKKWISMTNDLHTAEIKLDDLRKSLTINDVSDNNLFTESIISKSLQEWDHQRVNAGADYLEYSNILDHLNRLSPAELPAALNTAYAHQLDPELIDLSDRVQTAKTTMVSVQHELGPENPRYQAADQQLKQSQEALQKIDGVMAGIKTRVSEDENFLRIATEKENEITQKKNDEANRNRPYYDGKIDVEAKRRMCEMLEAQLMREMAQQAEPNQGVVVVCNPARADKKPIWPKSSLIIPLGVVVGLVVGLGLAFFIEYLDTSVKTIDDVERSLQAPVLGVIPQNVGIILEEGPESPHAEAYRVLRTNILFSRKNETWNTVTVLSGGAGEGKSTTLFNLATIFAQNGQRTLVVDSDLRRPTLHKILHVSNTMGLTDFLLKQRSLDEVIQKTKVPTLDFLASGKLPSSSMSILGSAQMKETIAELKRRYEFIFFDSPPLLGVSDASILASEMDMVLQVIQYRRYPQPMTLRAKQMILKVGGNLVGIVLNNINMSQDENYYYYSGYYEYEYRAHQKDEPAAQPGKETGKDNKAASAEIKPKYNIWIVTVLLMRLILKVMPRHLRALGAMASAVMLGACATTSAPPPSPNKPPPAETVDQLRQDPLRSGDFIQLDLAGTPETIAPQTKIITEDGSISLNYIGRITAAGKTPVQLEKEITAAYVPAYYTHISVTITPMARYIYVSGQVNNTGGSGKIPYTGPITLLGAITAAGDFTSFADKKHVQVTRKDGTMIKVNCTRAITHPELDVPIYPGDKIQVGRRF